MTAFPTVNQAAFFTITALGIGTAAACIAASAVVTTTATIAYSVLGIGLGSLSLGAIAAWVDTDNWKTAEYFAKIPDYTAYVFVGMIQLFAQSLLMAVFEGVASGVGLNIRRKIAGPDFTFRRV